MKRAVLDSWALLAFFKSEPSAPRVRECFYHAIETGVPLALCVVNWGEVVSQIERAGGHSAAESVIADMRELPIELFPADETLTRLAARFKARGGLSYADAFAAALAKHLKAELLTGDSEFRALEKEIKVRWLE